MSKCESNQQVGQEIQKSTNTKLFRYLFYEVARELQAIMEPNPKPSYIKVCVHG